MKYLSTLSVIILLTLLISCNEDDQNSSKPKITSFEVIQENSQITFNYSSDSEIQFFEISYSPSIGNDDYNPESVSSTIFTTSNSNTVSKNIVSETEILQEYYPEYLFSIRAIDFDGNKSDWYGPIIIYIEDFCRTPTDLDFSLAPEGVQISWQDVYNETNTGYAQIEYGLQGFVLGNGTTKETSQNYTTVSLEKGKAYDFYVRLYCSNNLGWSEWIGPGSYFYE